MRRGLVVAIVLLAACSSTTTTTKIGDTTYVSAGDGKIPAGVTRTAFSKAQDAALAQDRVGFNLLVAAGEIVLIDECSHGRLIDVAIGGEHQVRLDDGRAVWVDSSWLKESSSDCV